MNPGSMLRPRRQINGMSAVLLPFTGSGAVDWAAFERHVARTAAAGLVPAVNMDTGYVDRLTFDERMEALTRTRSVLAGDAFVAGAYVADEPGDGFDDAAYRDSMAAIAAAGATPVVFPSYGLASLEGDALVEAFATLAKDVDEFIAFELSPVFNPAGRIWDENTYERVVRIEQCIGAKHSSLDRMAEWRRLQIRDATRPDFMVLTGNDLAIDMVMYGSDYLLGLSTFAPDLFALRDRYWAEGDPAFYSLNDALQHLGNIAFRAPVPAYRHDAALFLWMRGLIGSDVTPDGVTRRPEWETELLSDAARRLGLL